MTKTIINSLHKVVRLETEIECDGPSLPILTFCIHESVGKHGSRRTYIMFNKEQTEELIANLRRYVEEM